MKQDAIWFGYVMGAKGTLHCKVEGGEENHEEGQQDSGWITKKNGQG